MRLLGLLRLGSLSDALGCGLLLLRLGLFLLGSYIGGLDLVSGEHLFSGLRVGILDHLVYGETYRTHLVRRHHEEAEDCRILALGHEVAKEVVEYVGMTVECQEFGCLGRVFHLWCTVLFESCHHT